MGRKISAAAAAKAAMKVKSYCGQHRPARAGEGCRGCAFGPGGGCRLGKPTPEFWAVPQPRRRAAPGAPDPPGPEQALFNAAERLFAGLAAKMAAGEWRVVEFEAHGAGFRVYRGGGASVRGRGKRAFGAVPLPRIWRPASIYAASEAYLMLAKEAGPKDADELERGFRGLRFDFYDRRKEEGYTLWGAKFYRGRYFRTGPGRALRA